MFQDWFVYLLRCSDDTLYCGVTTDLDRRLLEHNSAKLAAKYTRVRQPVVLVYHEKCQNRSAAQKREAAIKALSREGKLALIFSQEVG